MSSTFKRERFWRESLMGNSERVSFISKEALVFSKITIQTEAALILKLKVTGSESMERGSDLTCSAGRGRSDCSMMECDEDSEPRWFDPRTSISRLLRWPIKSPKPAELQRPAEPRRDTSSPARNTQTSWTSRENLRSRDALEPRLTLCLDT